MTLHDIRRLLFRSALLAIMGAMASASLAESAAIPTGHPLVATWSWTLFDGRCMETLQYRPDGTVLETSGESASEWAYETTPNASEKGFYEVIAQAGKTNGKKDCYGNITEINDAPDTRYIQFSPARDQMIVCRSESLEACFGPLKKP